MMRFERPDNSRSAHSIAFQGARVLVCGASGNLGSHVARQLAGQAASLSLWGRRIGRLESVAAMCSEGKADIATRSVDLRDVDAALAALREEDDRAPFDCAFFVAGAGDTREAGRAIDSPELLQRLGLLNYVAPAALSAELGERMAARRAGRIAIVGTAAASHPLPFAAGYASSKCGLAQFTEAMRIALKPHGVSVTLISPGFFAAEGADAYSYARPGEVAAEVVARQLVDATARRKSELTTPLQFLVLRWLGRALPRPLRDRVLSALPSS